jgi:hypothetical protein
MMTCCKSCLDPVYCLEHSLCLHGVKSDSWHGPYGYSGHGPIDYDRLAKTVVAEQERKAARDKRREDIKKLEALLPFLMGNGSWGGLPTNEAHLVADAIRAYIKAEAA